MGITQEAIRIPELCSPTRSLSTRYSYAEWETLDLWSLATIGTQEVGEKADLYWIYANIP